MDTKRARKLLDAEVARLESLKEAASSLVDQAQESEATELSRVDQHPSDVASELSERETQAAAEGLVEQDLAETRQALERLEAGRYGVCERCGTQIAEARLEAKPAARHCIDCQALVESGRA